MSYYTGNTRLQIQRSQGSRPKEVGQVRDIRRLSGGGYFLSNENVQEGNSIIYLKKKNTQKGNEIHVHTHNPRMDNLFKVCMLLLQYISKALFGCG